jgi:hypothetical protein
MIVVKIQGGLGNQLFQYAMARALSSATKEDFRLDTSFYPQQSLREYSLSHFSIQGKGATPFQIVWAKILTRLKIKNCYLDGYWQSENYFKKTEEIIRKEFTLKKPLGEKGRKQAAEITKNPFSVSLHVRRGDYASSEKVKKTIGLLPLNYYEEAIKKIVAQIPNAHFFIFSDDISWVKEHLHVSLPHRYISSVDIPDYEELILMSLCKNNITANSSFSWWGAWLNTNPTKVVIAPKKWFADKKLDSKELIPSSWITI